MSSNEWEKYTLGDIVDVKHGYAFKGEFFSDTPTNDILLSPGNFHIGGGFKSDKFKYYNGSYPKDYILKENDIIVTMTDLSKNGDTIGYSAKIPFEENKKFLHNQRLGLLIFKNSEFNKDFIYWLLRTNHYQLFIANSATGTTVRHTSPTRIKEYEFRAPDFYSQKIISSVLSSIENKIENNLQTNRTLEEIARAIFKEWFIYFNYPNADARIKQSEFGEIPSDWDILGIGEVCYVQNGYAFKSNDFKTEGEVGIIKIKNINGNVVDIENTDFVDYNVISKLDKKFKVESRALLIAMTGAQVGKVGLVPLSEKHLWLNQRVGMFKEKIAFGNLFMYLLLSSDTYQTNIQNSALGSAQPNISASAIESIRAIIPTAELIEQFGKIVNPMFEKILDNLAENETLKITRDSLLPKLMSGEIDVNISNE
jgi:type I restriction enzyme S subunit